jgi:TPR repeat protein
MRARGWRALLSALALGLASNGCSTRNCAESPRQSEAPPAEPLAATTAPEPAAPPTSSCPDGAEAERAAELFRQADALAAGCDELCMKSVEGGERMRRSSVLMDEAAALGNRDAQARAGLDDLGFLFTSIGVTEDGAEPRYVQALTYVRLAARRGDEQARSFIPELATLSLEPNGSLPPLEPPLSELPPDWVRRAMVEADRQLECHPDR